MVKVITTDFFIKKAIEIHGQRFDYSKTNYKNSMTPITIFCRNHGEFLQKPYVHLNSKQCCPQCNKETVGKWNIGNAASFIKNSKDIHENKSYDYSLVNYVNSITKVEIVCPVHGTFLITPNSHLNGKGCKECGKNQYSKANRLTVEEFCTKSNIIHKNKFTYENVVYVNRQTKVIITCPTHGNFEQTPGNHLSGRGCYKCSTVYSPTTNEWITKAIAVHGDLYNYTNTVYTGDKNYVSITCKKHGEFCQRPTNHLKGCGCSKCTVAHRYSKMQKNWLCFMEKFFNVKLQFENNDRNESEYLVPQTKYHVDGYCKESNTIFEFYGDYWHGNPKKYNLNDVNKINNKTFGDLYKKTIERENELKALGYNIVSMWETDWNKINKSISKIQQKFKLFKKSNSMTQIEI